MKKRATLAIVTATITAGQPAFAQTAPAADGAAAKASSAPTVDASGGEILVTGSRQRSESAQAAPIATTVLSTKVVESLHGNDITSIGAVVPNLIIQESNSVVGLPSISLRGFNTKSADVAAEPGIAVYIDGVYQTIQPGSLADTFDLQSLEVLRGPQSTLLGRNAPAGAILISRSRPTGEFGGKAQIETGSYGLIQGQALVNVPIVKDVLAAKVFGLVRSRDGYIKNDFLKTKDGKERRGTVRGALLFTPTSNFKAYLSAEYSWDRSEPKPTRNITRPDTATCAIFGYCNLGAGQVNVTSSDFVPPVYQNDYAATLVMDLDLGAATMRSTTGYRHYNSSNGNDLDNTPAIVLHAFDDLTRLNSISEEFRINSSKGGGLDLGGKLDWVLGAYIAHSTAFSSVNLNAFAGASITSQSERAIRSNYAVFASAEYEIIEPWSVSVGIRRSNDKIEHQFNLASPTTYPHPLPLPPMAYTENASFPRTTKEAGTRFKFDSSKMVYFRYAEGYKAGTFLGLPTVPNTPPLLPETSKSYEVGIKTDWFDNRLRLNLTLFDVNYKNLQVSTVRSGPRGLLEYASNADVKTKGVEVEAVVRPTDAFTIRGNFGYLNAHYGTFVIDLGNGQTQTVSGLQIPLAPKYNGNISADYTIDTSSANIPMLDSVVLHGNFNATSEQQTSINGDPIGLQKGYSTGDLAVTLNGPQEKYSLTFYVNNIGDTHWRTNTQVIAGLVDWVQDNIGRTWGLQLGVKF